MKTMRVGGRGTKKAKKKKKARNETRSRGRTRAKPAKRYTESAKHEIWRGSRKKTGKSTGQVNEKEEKEPNVQHGGEKIVGSCKRALERTTAA